MFVDGVTGYPLPSNGQQMAAAYSMMQPRDSMMAMQEMMYNNNLSCGFNQQFQLS